MNVWREKKTFELRKLMQVLHKTFFVEAYHAGVFRETDGLLRSRQKVCFWLGLLCKLYAGNCINKSGLYKIAMWSVKRAGFKDATGDCLLFTQQRENQLSEHLKSHHSLLLVLILLINSYFFFHYFCFSPYLLKGRRLGLKSRNLFCSELLWVGSSVADSFMRIRIQSKISMRIRIGSNDWQVS